MHDASQYTFCVCKANLFLSPQFFHFGINIGFVIPKEECRKDELHRGIKFIFLTRIWMIWVICEFYFWFQVEERTHV